MRIPDLNRREALFGVAGAGLASLAAEMPRVKFGSHTISRLIVGGNPISGTSHLSPQLSREMVDYFTAANSQEAAASVRRGRRQYLAIARDRTSCAC